jgi:ABC-type polysaccharide/polyol phosphate transport system ATPase subunit
MIDLEFNGVSKRYRISQEDASGTTGKTTGAAGHPLLRKLKGLRQRKQEFWALRPTSFEVARGETLGIIGHNGAGKSTILKLLSGITTPTAGEITINGRLAALIEVGSGFHPELTGRENVFLNGSILGMRRREIAEKLDSIIDFAGVRDFIDVPVKRYSSGMYVRLGFSIAAHLDPDILLLDEVLAVGDAGFQEKCLQRIRELERAGKTIIFISHDLSAVERLCDRVLLLQQGEIIADGPPRQVIACYRQSGVNFVPSTPPTVVSGGITKRAEVTSLKFYDEQGREAAALSTGECLTVRIECQVHERVAGAVIDVIFYDGTGNLDCHFTSKATDGELDLKPGRHIYEFHCPVLGLLPGTYYVDASIERANDPELVDWQYRCALLQVNGNKPLRGGSYMPHHFRPVMNAESNGKAAIKPGAANAVLRAAFRQGNFKG